MIRKQFERLPEVAAIGSDSMAAIGSDSREM
jgi:hypothetical protein